MQRSVLLLSVVAISLTPLRLHADVITFDQLNGPSVYVNAGNAQTLSIPTSIGNVIISGGVILSNTTFIPADTTPIYGTEGNATSFGLPARNYTNPITVSFPVPIQNFFLDVLNGNVINVDYTVSDNTGNSAMFNLVPNLSNGQKTIGFAATGTTVNIAATSGQSTPTGYLWDYFIDNIHFNEALPLTITPEPASFVSMGIGCFGILGYGFLGKALSLLTRKSQSNT